MIYEYACPKCSHAFEVEHKMTEPGPRQCPACQAPHPRRQISKSTSFKLKGGGWASTGYGSTK